MLCINTPLSPLSASVCSDNSYADFLASSVGNTTADKTATGVGIRQVRQTEFAALPPRDWHT